VHRYFIVVDDLWEWGTWSFLGQAMIENNCQSRIIMTTRIGDVADEVRAIY
jgi:hypothetical protein